MQQGVMASLQILQKVNLQGLHGPINAETSMTISSGYSFRPPWHLFTDSPHLLDLKLKLRHELHVIFSIFGAQISWRWCCWKSLIMALTDLQRAELRCHSTQKYLWNAVVNISRNLQFSQLQENAPDRMTSFRHSRCHFNMAPTTSLWISPRQDSSWSGVESELLPFNADGIGWQSWSLFFKFWRLVNF